MFTNNESVVDKDRRFSSSQANYEFSNLFDPNDCQFSDGNSKIAPVDQMEELDDVLNTLAMEESKRQDVNDKPELDEVLESLAMEESKCLNVDENP